MYFFIIYIIAIDLLTTGKYAIDLLTMGKYAIDLLTTGKYEYPCLKRAATVHLPWTRQ